jgi:hypothetical protein
VQQVVAGLGPAGAVSADHEILLALCRVASDVLIVSLLDGHVVALDQNTGRILWTFDSGAPLVSAKQSFSSSQGLNVFPGTDGGLYAYHGITHLNPGLEVSQATNQRPCSISRLHSGGNIDMATAAGCLAGPAGPSLSKQQLCCGSGGTAVAAWQLQCAKQPTVHVWQTVLDR